MTEKQPLLGFTVATTGARRSEELQTLLHRRGARVTGTAAIELVPLAHDEQLREATDALIAGPPELFVATTAVGFRGWLAAAEDWGIAEELLAALRTARIISRGPKATGALRAAGLSEDWAAPSESSAEIVDHLTGDDLTGRRIAVQLQGTTGDWFRMPGPVEALTAVGADVVSVPVYRYRLPSDPADLDHLVETVGLGGVDAVTFTSAPAAAALLHRAAELGLHDSVRHSLATTVLSFGVGPITAVPLERAGIPVITPARMRLGALARTVAEELPRRRPDLSVAGHRLGLRATGVVTDGQFRELTPNSLLLLRLLARRPGAVISRSELLAVLGGEDPHAVDAAIARLRAALGLRQAISTVVKRGYRLAVDEPAQTSEPQTSETQIS